MEALTLMKSKKHLSHYFVELSLSGTIDNSIERKGLEKKMHAMQTYPFSGFFAFPV